LIERSVRELQCDDYTQDQIDGALASGMFGVDTTLIDDGTYLVIEATVPCSLVARIEGSSVSGTDGTITACGGWSKRKTLYGGDVWGKREDDLLDPAVDAAKIRAFFVHPDWARRGFGSLLLDACEKAARAAGFRRFELGATLTGVRLYERRGYVAVGGIGAPLPGGFTLPVVRMVKIPECT
jgi:GNAT superfamily N-acetyltransferase